MLEQLRKQQGSVLHPNYSAAFHSFEDTLHSLLPYHLYQGTANSSQDYQKGTTLVIDAVYSFVPLSQFHELHTRVASPAQWMMSLRRSPALS